MKLKYFFSAALFAFALTACTSNDGPENPDPVQTGNAELTIGVKNVATKAINEDSVEDLTVLVFNGTGGSAVLEVIGELDPNNEIHTDNPGIGEYTSDCMKLSAGQKSILVLANVEALGLTFTEGTTTLADAVDLKQTLDAPYTNDGSITMSSAVYVTTLIAGAHNIYGFPNGDDYDGYTVLSREPVKLYRTISKITVGEVSMKTGEGVKYPEAQLTIKNVFALRGASSTYLAANTTQKWGQIYDGASATHFYGVDFDAIWADEKDEAVYIQNFVTDGDILDDSYNFFNGKAVLGFEGDAKKAFGNIFYAFENISTDWTLLVIHGDYSYMHYEYNELGAVVSSTRIYLENRYYTVRIGDPSQGADFSQVEGAADFPERTAGYSGIMRNLHYNIKNIVINGTGSSKILYENDGDASLDVFAEVVAYGEVEQDWEFE